MLLLQFWQKSTRRRSPAKWVSNFGAFRNDGGKCYFLRNYLPTYLLSCYQWLNIGDGNYFSRTTMISNTWSTVGCEIVFGSGVLVVINNLATLNNVGSFPILKLIWGGAYFPACGRKKMKSYTSMMLITDNFSFCCFNFVTFTFTS